jgi:hypothetical protein
LLFLVSLVLELKVKGKMHKAKRLNHYKSKIICKKLMT